MPNGNYEDAPATAMLATHCCCCGKPLLDAESVEIGMGPTCREKHGFHAPSVSAEARAEANKLVHEIALDPPGHMAEILRLRVLGFETLADKIASRLDTVCSVEAVGRVYRLFTAKSEKTISTIKTVGGWSGGSRQWDPANRCWALDALAARAVIPALEQIGLYVPRTPEVAALLALPEGSPELAQFGGGFGDGGSGRDRFVAVPPSVIPDYKWSVQGDRVSITTPYNAAAVGALKAAATGWRKFDGSTKSWIVELADAAKVALALRPFFPGLTDEMLADERIAKPVAAYSWSIEGDRATIKTAYNAEAVAALKGAAQGEARFNGENKSWSFSLSAAAKIAEALRPFYPGLADELLADSRIAGESQARGEREALSTAAAISEGGPGAEVAARLAALIPEGLVPYPYQFVGVAFVEAARGRALIADVMGLGKTVQALLWLALHPEIQRILIVVPASLTINWLREAKKWAPQISSSITRNGKDRIQDTRIIITSYECATRRKAEWMAWAPECVVLDECHYCKNQGSQRTKALCGVEPRKNKTTGQMSEPVPGIVTAAKHVVALSGTPMLNRPIELFTTLHMIVPSTFGSFFGYAKRYAAAEQTRYGWDFTGASNVDELRGRLKDIMVRREKEQVLKELPPKRRAEIFVALSNASEYAEVEEDLKDKFTNSARREERTKGDVLVGLGKLRMLAGIGKVEPAVEWIANADKPVVVFCHHREVVDAIAQALTEQEISWVKVTGDVAVEKRQDAVDEFQAGRATVFLGTYGAAGVGLTLTAASDTLHVERSWTPSGEEQAEDRCHRIGQCESVTAWYMMSGVSIDAKFQAMVSRKRAVIKSVMDGAGQGEEEESIMAEMAREIFGEGA
jgi:SWI/SNF-related matrix-associated actin-dependent regulator of chromatin subfamily A-like protein 1